MRISESRGGGILSIQKYIVVDLYRGIPLDSRETLLTGLITSRRMDLVLLYVSSFQFFLWDEEGVRSYLRTLLIPFS